MIKVLRALLMFSCAILLSPPAMARDDWPNRPIRVIVPTGPGGTSDILMRVLAEYLTKDLGQPIVVENRPGAGGTVAAGMVARASPDGYTFMMNSVATHGIAPSMYKLPFDPDKDVTPVAQFGFIPNVLYVRKDFPDKSVRELIDDAKKHPGKLTYSSSGSGTSLHLSGVLFAKTAGIDLLHIPYNGASPSLQAVLSGDTSMSFENVTPVIAQIKAGTVLPLAVTSATRSSQMPDVPTMAQAGLPGFDVSSWYGFVAPPGIPAAVTDAFSSAIRKILQNPAAVARIQAFGVEPRYLGPQEFGAMMKAERGKWRDIVKASGASVN